MVKNKSIIGWSLHTPSSCPEIHYLDKQTWLSIATFYEKEDQKCSCNIHQADFLGPNHTVVYVERMPDAYIKYYVYYSMHV